EDRSVLTIHPKIVASRPGFPAPYHELAVMATANTTSRLSTTSDRSKAGINASVMLKTATPYRRMVARAGAMRVRIRGSFNRIRGQRTSHNGKPRVTRVHGSPALLALHL